MIDMIEIGLKINTANHGQLTERGEWELKTFINNLRNHYGQQYCDCFYTTPVSLFMRITPEVKFTSPMLTPVSNLELFCDSIDNHPLLVDATIFLREGTKQFNFTLPPTTDFGSYGCLLKIFDYVSEENDLELENEVISNDSDALKIGDLYSNKARIYNVSILQTEITISLNQLQNSIMLEISKGNYDEITRDEFISETEFEESEYREELVNSIMDIDIIKTYYEESEEELSDKLLEFSNQESIDKYEEHVHNTLAKLTDYEKIRRGLELAIDESDTLHREVLEEVLNGYKHNKNVVNGYKLVQEMIKVIQG